MKPISEFLKQVQRDEIDKTLRWDTSHNAHRQLLERAGYYSIDAPYAKPWNEVHQWCNEYIGSEHYTWTGHTFWFDDRSNLILFVLRWY